MIPAHSVKSNMFKGFNASSFYKDPLNGKERRSIFGNLIPQTAKAKENQKSSACCVVENAGQMPAGGFKMNAFYSTIWKRNLRNILSSNMAFGENCCND
jgi:hypothetical protein